MGYMKKITRKQAVSNMQCLFDDFFKTYFNAPKEAIDETIENKRFHEQKERLRKAVYSTEYNSILGSLDSESFSKYYEKVGEFAKAYKIDMRLFTEETPALIKDINEVLSRKPNIGEKLDLINGFTDEELKTDTISFETKITLIGDLLGCWFVGDDKEQGINRMLMSLTAEDRKAFVKKISEERKFLNRMIQCVNGREKDEMLAVLGEILIDSGFCNEGSATIIDKGKSDKIEATYINGRVSITVFHGQVMGVRDYRMGPESKHVVDALDSVSMDYDGRIINVPAILLLNSWSNDMAEPEGLFYNYRHEDIDWNSLDEEQKDVYFSEFVKHYMGEALYNELIGNPFGLVLTTIVGILLTYFAAIPAAVMAVVGAGIAGANIWFGINMLTPALKRKADASSMHELKQAARDFAESITKIGVNILMLVVSLVQTGKAVHKGKVISIDERSKVTSQKFSTWEEMKNYYKEKPEKVTEFLQKNKPKYSPAPQKWFNKGGVLEIKEINGDKIWTYINKNGDSVPYINGYIKFPEKYLHPDFREINIGSFSGKRYIDNDKLLEILRNDYGVVEIPDGYIPHHDITDGIFQFVEESIHNEFTHIGGNSLHGGK